LDGRVQTISDDERRARLAARHGLATPTPDVAAATAAMTCLHATEPASVHLAAFARCGASIDEVDEVLYRERTVVKQLAMRRTVFAFPRELLPAVWGSAAARVAAQQRSQLARDVVKAGITRDGERWVRDTTSDVLATLHEGPRTTMELRAALPALAERIVVSPGKSYGGEFPIAPRVLTTLAASGAIVRGDNDGGWKTSRPRWTVTTDWIDAGPALDETEGYAALVRSWLRTFGPGTEADIVWWLGATKAAVRRALADVDAVEVRLAHGTGWLLPDDLDDLDDTDAPDEWAALLPALDPTTMGWKERDFYLGEHAERLFDRNGNGGPSAWWCGRIVGGWTQSADGSVVVVPAEPLDPAAARALDAEAGRLTAWLAGDVVKSIYQSPLVRASSSSST
jgi:hypothetical protein